MAKQNSVSYSPAIEPEKICWRRSQKAMEESRFHSYPQSTEMPSTQTRTMEFLCRTWSPSSNDFLQMLSGNHVLPVRGTDREYHEEQLEEISQNTTNKALTNREDDSSVMKQWPKGKSLTRFFRSHLEKKEKLRQKTAKMHAALSLTQLAAAISGFARSGKAEAQDFHFNNDIAEQRNNMGVVVASAAALVTTVCAEAAESLGAGRVQVAAAVKSGLAIQTPIDMLAVTATAATCLRGAAILKSRILEDSFSRTPYIKMRVSARIWIIMPSGHIEDKWVTVHLKQNQLILSIGKKNFWALRTSKDYKLVSIIKECTEGQHNYILSLKTDSGIVKLLFEDMNQSRIWISTISYLLEKNKES